MQLELTDLQLKCLLLCDAIRWGETEHLSPYNYHLIRRQLAMGDVVVTFEMNRAAEFCAAYGTHPPESPPPGPLRSPWLNTYGITLEQVLGIDPSTPDLSEFSH